MGGFTNVDHEMLVADSYCGKTSANACAWISIIYNIYIYNIYI